MSDIDPQSTLDQVILGLRGKIDAKNQSAEIHLEPQNLGSVHVSINVANSNTKRIYSCGEINLGCKRASCN